MRDPEGSWGGSGEGRDQRRRAGGELGGSGASGASGGLRGTRIAEGNGGSRPIPRWPGSEGGGGRCTGRAGPCGLPGVTVGTGILVLVLFNCGTELGVLCTVRSHKGRAIPHLVVHLIQKISMYRCACEVCTCETGASKLCVL